MLIPTLNIFDAHHVYYHLLSTQHNEIDCKEFEQPTNAIEDPSTSNGRKYAFVVKFLTDKTDDRPADPHSCIWQTWERRTLQEIITYLKK